MKPTEALKHCRTLLFTAALLLAAMSPAPAKTPDISISDVTAPEGNNGVTPFDFTVTLSKVVSNDVTIDFSTANGTATTSNNDYVFASSTLTIPAGELSGTITIDVVGDAAREDTETFFVNLSNASAGTIVDGQGQGNILDDDPTIWIDNVAKLEGDAGTTNFDFQVRLSSPLSEDMTVEFATSDGSATVADNDYIPVSGTLTILANSTSAVLTVQVVGDTNDDGPPPLDHDEPERFYVTISNPSLGMIVDDEGEGAILDDDTALTGIDDRPVTEFALGRVAPNPAFGIARISYALPKPVHVRLAVFDLQGREVAVLVDGAREAGRYAAEWSGRGDAQGTYFYRLQAGSFVQTRKFTLMK